MSELYLEIGPGLAPAPLHGSRHFEDGRLYLGVDSAEGDYCRRGDKDYGQQVNGRLAELATRFAVEKPSEKILLVKGDGRYLPIADGAAREVYMANVLTAPIRSDHRRQLLVETNRVLADDGKVVIKVSWDAWLWPHNENEIAEMLGKAQLHVDKVVTSDTEEFSVLEQTYGPPEHRSKGNYYVIASKMI